MIPTLISETFAVSLACLAEGIISHSFNQVTAPPVTGCRITAGRMTAFLMARLRSGQASLHGKIFT
jgi:hypothetical protein